MPEGSLSDSAEAFNRAAQDEALRRFGASTTGSVSRDKVTKNRRLFYDIHVELRKLLPPGRYASMALSALEEASMWANKAITESNPKQL